MHRNESNTTTLLPMNEFFGWKHHPFADTYVQRQPWMPEADKQKLETIKRLLHHGKSTALCGPSGAGKTTLLHALISSLAKNVYLLALLPYAVHPRSGLTRFLAQALGVDVKGRGMPLITRIQEHIEALSGNAPPVILFLSLMMHNGLKQALYGVCVPFCSGLPGRQLQHRLSLQEMKILPDSLNYT